MSEMPKEIWMQQSYDQNHFDTWCTDVINEDDVNFVRRDIYTTALRNVREALATALGCFEAADYEGLLFRMAEEKNRESGSLYDLLSRRIIHAQPEIEAALATLDELMGE